MTTTELRADQDDVYRPVPLWFEDWLAGQNAPFVGLQRCEMCSRERDCWDLTPGRDDGQHQYQCEPCLRRDHAFYFQRDRAVRETLEALDPQAIRAILKLHEFNDESYLVHDLTHKIAAWLVARDTRDEAPDMS